MWSFFYFVLCILNISILIIELNILIPSLHILMFPQSKHVLNCLNLNKNIFRFTKYMTSQTK